MEKYDITDYLKDDKELQKAVIQELLDDLKCAVMNVENLLETKQRLKGELATLKAENERLKEENYQLQKDCQICENFIDFIPCKPIRDMDYDLQKVINQRDKYYKTLQEIKTIAEFHITEEDSEDVQNDMKQIIDLITKAEEE